MKKILFLMCLVLLSSVTAFEFPDRIGKQGVLRNASSNAPIDGNILMSLYILNQSGDTLYWENDTVSVASGVYNYLVGGISTIQLTTFLNNSVKIRTGIAGTNLSDTNVTAVPYSYVSLYSNNSLMLNGQESSYYLPYTGASKNIDLNNKNVTNQGIINADYLVVTPDTQLLNNDNLFDRYRMVIERTSEPDTADLSISDFYINDAMAGFTNVDRLFINYYDVNHPQLRAHINELDLIWMRYSGKASPTGSSSIGNLSFIKLDTFNDINTDVTNVYGIQLADISGATNNWAIKTNAGLVDFGDNTIIRDNLNVTGLICDSSVCYIISDLNSSDTDTNIGTDNIYIWNNSGVATFNESKLNTTVATVKVNNATFSDDSSLLDGAAAATYLDDTTVANCSVNGSCANIVYDTEKIANATHADTASDITGAVSNATYASDSALLGGAAAATYLDNVNTNCSVANSCSGIVYTAELANATIIRTGNTSWKVDNATHSDSTSSFACTDCIGTTETNESDLGIVPNATYSSDSALLGGVAAATYLDDTTIANCSVANSCSGIVYTAELDNETIIRVGNTSWKVDNSTWADEAALLDGQAGSYYDDDNPDNDAEVPNDITIASTNDMNTTGNFNVNQKFNVTAGNGNVITSGNVTIGAGLMYYNGSHMIFT